MAHGEHEYDVVRVLLTYLPSGRGPRGEVVVVGDSRRR